MGGCDKSFMLFGAAALGKVALDAAMQEGWECVGVFDDNSECHGKKFLSSYVIQGGKEKLCEQRETTGVSQAFIAIGTPSTRKIISDEFVKKNFLLITITHPFSCVSPHARVGQGSIIMPGAVIEPDADIGRGVSINPQSVVAHDCVVGDYCQLSGGVVLAGGVKIGECTFLGAGVAVKPNITICANVVIGAGAAVVKDITTPGVWVGVPAKPLI